VFKAATGSEWEEGITRPSRKRVLVHFSLIEKRIWCVATWYFCHFDKISRIVCKTLWQQELPVRRTGQVKPWVEMSCDDCLERQWNYRSRYLGTPDFPFHQG